MNPHFRPSVTGSSSEGRDAELMQEIAEIGHGEHYHAAGSIDEYREELREIFKELGGKRPAVLIE